MIPGTGARRLRVAHAITRLELGGAQRNTLYTVAHLDRGRFEPLLVCGPGGLLDDEARACGAPVTFLEALVRELDPRRDGAALLRLTALWRRLRPDIVHTHSSKAGVLGRLSAHLAGVPLVVHTIHGYGFHPAQPAALRRLLLAAERAVAPLTTHFVAVSRANLLAGLRLGLFPRSAVSLIRSGVDTRLFREARPDRSALAAAGVPPGAPVVGMVACLKPQKAPLDFVEVARRVGAAFPEAHFAVVGDGELRGAVERAARRAGLGGRLHLLGWRHDVPGLLKAFDLLVHTSRWEGLPRVFLEALAAGLPVVATDVDGAPDVIHDGRNGYLLPPGDVAGIAARVGRLLGDPEERRRLGEGGLAGGREFEIDWMVEQQERLYGRLWAERAGRGAGPIGEEQLAGARA
jgi:glycosyltransferase involved in cell wall biosynthesis